jgi:hypothetical protein
MLPAVRLLPVLAPLKLAPPKFAPPLAAVPPRLDVPPVVALTSVLEEVPAPPVVDMPETPASELPQVRVKWQLSA